MTIGMTNSGSGGGGGGNLIFNNINSTTYTANARRRFQRRFTLACPGATSSMTPQVYFSFTDISGDNIGPYAQSDTDAVYVWTTNAVSSITAERIILIGE